MCRGLRYEGGGLFPGIALKHHAIEDEPAGTGILSLCVLNSNRESVMGLAEYMIVAQGDEWGVLHDGSVNNRYATKEAAFEAAVCSGFASYSGGT